MKFPVQKSLMTSSNILAHVISSLNSERGLTGLQNIGNTCFLNSVIQCLSNTRPLLEYILGQDYLKEIRYPSQSLLIKRFAELIQNIWDDHRSLVSTLPLKSALVLYAPRFNGYSQHDAQEFLRYLLEGLHQEVNRAEQVQLRSDSIQSRNRHSDSLSATETWQKYLKTDNSKVVDIFGGLLKSILKCTYCGFASTVFEPFWDLSLSIPFENDHTRVQKLHLSHCLNFFTKEEKLDGQEKPFCEKCKTTQTCIKRILIHRFPRVLVIHLKRFSGNGNAHKIDNHVDYPLLGLNMGAYSSEAQFQNVSYNLYGVINHFGTCHFGHYTAYCKHPYSGRWHRFNDRSVSQINPDQADKSEAYILFYEATIFKI